MRLCLCAFVLLAACKSTAARDDTARVSVRCVGPDIRDVVDTVTLRGRVAPPPGGDLAVAAQVAGRLTSVEVHEGQKLASGDIVATVDDAPARDALGQAQAAVAQVAANEANAVATRDRVRTLVGRGIAAKQELDDAEARVKALHADANAARASADLAQRTFGHVSVRTTVAGVVTHVWRGPGALVDGTAATPIVQVASSVILELVADATVNDIAKISLGDVTQTTLSTGATSKGSVVSRSSALDPLTGLGIVRIAMEDVPPGVPMGTFGSSVISTSKRSAVMTFPVSVLRGAVADGVEVVVCAGGKAQLRRVEVGWREADHVELRGVAVSEHLASDHVLGLENDEPIAEGE